MPTKLSRICDGFMEAAWLAVVILTPLFFNVNSSRIFEPDKIALLRSLSLFLLAAWIVKILDSRGMRKDKSSGKQSFGKSISQLPLMMPMIAIAVVYIVSTIFSVSPRVSVLGSYQRMQGTYTTLSYLVIFAVMISNLRTRVQVERIMTAIIITSLPISIYGILQKIQLDPVPWGGDTSIRIASNMGNSIFVAAYLIMVIILLVGRLVHLLTYISKSSGKQWPRIILLVLYVFILVIDIVAVILSGSRGPFLGMFVGIILLVLLLTAYWKLRWATITLLSIAILAGLFLIFLNIPNSPLENLKNTSWMGRFSHIFDTEQRTSQVRILIWKGAAKLVLPHTPLLKPDGEVDPFNFLRPLIGYGPESMYVAYNQYYPPELGGVEKRNATPDRSHNETWDSLVITGFVGLLAYLWIFNAVFYYGLKWLKLIEDRKQVIIYWSLIVFGSVIGVISLGIWQGWEFFGIGIPFGMVFGLCLYVICHSLFINRKVTLGQQNLPDAIILMALLAGVVSHFIEINFGIAIAVTRSYFWVYSALMVLLGFILPRNEENNIAAASTLAPGKKYKGKQDSITSRHGTVDVHGIIFSSYSLSLILTTIGFDFIINSNRQVSPGLVISSSFTTLPSKNDIVSYGVIVLILSTWIVGALIYSCQDKLISTVREFSRTIGVTLSISAAIALFYYGIHAGKLVQLAQFTPKSQADLQSGLIQQANSLGEVLTNYYVYIFILLVAVACSVLIALAVKENKTTIGWFTVPLLLIISWSMVYFLNIRVIHADMTFKTADPFAQNNQWPVATLLYQHAIDQNPDEDHYYLNLGRSYLEQAKGTDNNLEQDELIRKAEETLKEAQRVNPLNTDHTANLGRLYSWWASIATNQTEYNRRAIISSGYYGLTTQLSPNNPTLWGEWAMLYLKILGDSEEALQRLQHAISLDDQYNYTQGLMGDYYTYIAHGETEYQAKVIALKQAERYYIDAVDFSVGRDSATKYNYLISLGNTYIELGTLNSEDLDFSYLSKAIEAFRQSLEAGVKEGDVWKIEETVAKLYAQMGDITQALEHANAALVNCPDGQKEHVLELIEQLKSMP